MAHGLLVLSVLAASISEMGLVPKDAKGVLNYGVDKARFVTPVLADCKITNSCKLVSFEEKGEGRLLVKIEATTNIVDMPRPAVVAGVLAMVVT